MYKILVTLTFSEPGNKSQMMTTTVVSFETLGQATKALEAIEKSYPKNAIYATASKLY